MGVRKLYMRLHKIWNPTKSEVYNVRKIDNPEYLCAVKVLKDDLIVGYLPQKYSTACSSEN